MKTIDKYISEKLVINKDIIKDNSIKFICVVPFASFFEFLRDKYSDNRFYDKDGFQLFIFDEHQIHDLIEECVKTKGLIDKSVIAKNVFLYEIPSKYGNNCKDIINNIKNISNFEYHNFFKPVDIKEYL